MTGFKYPLVAVRPLNIYLTSIHLVVLSDVTLSNVCRAAGKPRELLACLRNRR